MAFSSRSVKTRSIPCFRSLPKSRIALKSSSESCAKARPVISSSGSEPRPNIVDFSNASIRFRILYSILYALLPVITLVLTRAATMEMDSRTPPRFTVRRLKFRHLHPAKWRSSGDAGGCGVVAMSWRGKAATPISGSCCLHPRAAARSTDSRDRGGREVPQEIARGRASGPARRRAVRATWTV